MRASIQPISATAPAGINYGFRLTPDGQTFAHPITLTYTPTPGDLDNTTPAAVGLAFQTATQTWQVMPGTSFDIASNTFSTSTTHFTDYNYFASFHLFSSAPSGLLTAGTATLSVVQVLIDRCSGASPDDCLQQAGDVTRTTANGLNWEVNGQLGGNGTDGTVTQDRNPATYTAPAAVPANNLVAVSAILTPDGSTQLTLSKNLYVLAHKYHVDVVFEDQTTCTPLPAGGTPVFGYDIFTGGNFSITFNSSLNGTAGDFVSTTDTPPTTLAAFQGCATGSSATYNPGATQGLELDAASAGFSTTNGDFNVFITGAYSGQPAATLSFGGTNSKELAQDRSTGSIAGFGFKGVDNEKVIIASGNNINIFKKRTYTLKVLAQ